MANIHPHQIVKGKYGSKENLVDQLTGKLERIQDETDEAFKARLLTVSNKKLLRLTTAADRVAGDFGTKDNLLDAIVGFKFSKPNADYRAKLAGYRITRLLDLHDSFKKRSK